MSWSDITEFLSQDWVARGLRIAGLLVAAFIVSRALRKAVTKVEARASQDTTPLRHMQRTQTLAKILSSTGIVVIWVITAIYMLTLLGYNPAPLLAGIGVVGLAIGFGAQSLVKDIVTGFFILLEDQFGIGDNVELNQVASGKVEQLTLRMTGLRSLDGTMHFIANGEITHVANRSREWSSALVDVGVAYKEKPERVRAVLEQVSKEVSDPESPIARSLYSEPVVMGMEMLGEYEVVWRVKVDTKPGKQWEVARALRERIKVAFDAAGIEIPFPHRVMVNADGDADRHPD